MDPPRQCHWQLREDLPYSAMRTVFLLFLATLVGFAKSPSLQYPESQRVDDTVINWIEMGGIYVVATLRGGGEYGEEWHQAGMKGKKQNVFDDFIASAEFLIAEKYTSSPKLAIAGGSNGGLLVGACMTQRPELYAAALPAVGVMDMLRFHKWTISWGWIPEYGSPDEAKEFPALHAYSPYHNLKTKVRYPLCVPQPSPRSWP